MAIRSQDERNSRFLCDLYGDAYETTSAFLELRAIPSSRNSGHTVTGRAGNLRNATAIADYAARYAGERTSSYGVYFGIGLRSTADINAKKDAVKVLPGFWADIDTERMGWSLTDTAKQLHALPGSLQPSICVMSGGGLHAYWLFDAPIELAPGDSELIKQIESTNKRLASIVGGDNVSDITRVFRLPGTWNTKHKTPKRCDVLWSYRWHRHDPEVVASAADAHNVTLSGQTVEAAQRSRSAAASPKPTVDSIAAAIMGHRTDKQRSKALDELRDEARPGNLHNTVLRLVAMLHCRDPELADEFITDQAVALLDRVRDEHPEYSFDRTAERAKAQAMLDAWKPKWSDIVATDKKAKAAKRKAKAEAKRASQEASTND
jgi:hypothetical protein